VLGIGEGIETALSAAALFGVPCWAAGNDVDTDWNDVHQLQLNQAGAGPWLSALLEVR
jgi:hypothetical protein